MSRTLIPVLTLALLSALPAPTIAATGNRYSASTSLVPNATASGGRFSLQAQLLEPGARPPSDAKQAEPIRSAPLAETRLGTRFKLLAALLDKNAPTGSVCAADTFFQDGFE